MTRVIGLLLLVGAIGVAAYMGCGGARMGVAKDAALKKIDDLLGPLNVKQKEVENAYAELKSATAGIREKRIEASVRLKSFEAKKMDLQSEQEKLKADLTKLKGLLDKAQSDGKIEAGEEGVQQEVSLEQLKTYADARVSKLKMTNDQLAKNNVIMGAWAKNFELLKKNEETSEAQLAKLDSQLEQIRSKKSALDGMKEAATIAGPGASVSDKFNELTDNVEELLVNIDTQWEIEKVKLDDRIAELGSDDLVSIDELLNDKTDVSGTMSEIDELLNSN